MLENPNWQEADQWAIYTAQPRSWTRGKNKSSEWQGGGLEPEKTRLQDQNPNHSATPPRVTSAIDALSGHFGLLLQ